MYLYRYGCVTEFRECSAQAEMQGHDTTDQGVKLSCTYLARERRCWRSNLRLEA